MDHMMDKDHVMMTNTSLPPGDHSGHDTMPSDDHSEHDTGGHQEAFYLSNEAVILFMQWTTHDWQSLLYSCIGVGIVAILYEGLKTFRDYLNGINRKRQSYKSYSGPTICTGIHLMQTLLHIVQMAISYGLMLIFMTFNGWLCISILGGAGLGYLIFGWKRTSNSDADETCH